MRPTATGLACNAIFFLLAFNGYAATTDKINLRDPAVWEEKAADISPDETLDSCNVFSSSVCPGWEEDKSDLQRESERREKQRFYHDAEKYFKKK